MLEAPRTGLETRTLDIGGTPATLMQVPGTRAPVVVIAHGFAGSRPLMAPIQLTLARAGYITVSFDFEGHGRNPQPMRGDVNDIDGTTQFLLDEMARVTDAAMELEGSDGRLALVGHSMASDLVVRQGVNDPRVDAVVALSMFSEAVTNAEPDHLLILNGAMEGRLREPTRQIMADLGASEGETVGDPSGDFARRAVAVPWAEHVGILYAATTLSETLDWLNAVFGRDEANGLALLGLPIFLTLIGLVLVAQPLTQGLRAGRKVNEVPPGAFWTLALVPAVLTPLILRVVPTHFLPVLVADYLAVHLAVYGVLVLGGLALEGDLPRVKGWRAGLAVALYGIVVVGGVLDRHVGNFIVTDGRWPIFAALLPGALLAMTADATLIQAGQARPWRRIVARGAFLGSLLLAVVLDTERLFFLVLMFPVILLFFATYGLIGGWVGRRTGSSFAMGLGLGIILAWALAATFPLFEGSL
ncbi:alpha/beta fold hydrolase [Rhodobacterales bacterium HKCCE3408]|nr:alpha/beta fold hydrolase [Rhodobacterales bacterium HKCCE3408]